MPLFLQMTDSEKRKYKDIEDRYSPLLNKSYYDYENETSSMEQEKKLVKYGDTLISYENAREELYQEREKREINYFATHIDELYEKLKYYVKSNIDFIRLGQSLNDKWIKQNYENDEDIKHTFHRELTSHLKLLLEKASEQYDEIIKFIDKTLEDTQPVKTRTFRAKELKFDRSKVNKAIRSKQEKLYTEDGLLIETGHIGKKKNPVYTPVRLNFVSDELEKNGFSVEGIGHLDAFDMEVLMHAESLYEAGNKIMTVDMIVTQMAGGRRTQATPKLKEEIYKSLLRLRLTNITINTENEQKAGYNKHVIFSGVVLPNKIESEIAIINGKRIEEYIHIFDISPLSKYADIKNQISRPPVNMLDVPVSLTTENIILKHYLARRITDMQSPDEWRGKYVITYKTIFEYLQIEAKYSAQSFSNKKGKIRETVREIFKEWKKKGIIIDFEELGKDDKPPKSRAPIVKIKITMPTLTPEIKEC